MRVKALNVDTGETVEVPVVIVDFMSGFREKVRDLAHDHIDLFEELLSGHGVCKATAYACLSSVLIEGGVGIIEGIANENPGDKAACALALGEHIKRLRQTLEGMKT